MTFLLLLVSVTLSFVFGMRYGRAVESKRAFSAGWDACRQHISTHIILPKAKTLRATPANER